MGKLETITCLVIFDKYPLSQLYRNTCRDGDREGEGQRVRNRIIQKMKHREALKQQAIERGESVEDWDKIVLVGKKIRQQQQEVVASLFGEET